MDHIETLGMEIWDTNCEVFQSLVECRIPISVRSIHISSARGLRTGRPCSRPLDSSILGFGIRFWSFVGPHLRSLTFTGSQYGPVRIKTIFSTHVHSIRELGSLTSLHLPQPYFPSLSSEVLPNLRRLCLDELSLDDLMEIRRLGSMPLYKEFWAQLEILEFATHSPEAETYDAISAAAPNLRSLLVEQHVVPHEDYSQAITALKLHTNLEHYEWRDSFCGGAHSDRWGVVCRHYPGRKYVYHPDDDLDDVWNWNRCLRIADELKDSCPHLKTLVFRYSIRSSKFRGKNHVSCIAQRESQSSTWMIRGIRWRP